MGEGMTKDRAWTEADFRDFQSGKRLQEKIDCMNVLTAYRLQMEKLVKLGLLKSKGRVKTPWKKHGPSASWHWKKK